MNGDFTYKEIMEQGTAWSKSLSRAEAQFEKIKSYLKEEWSEVLFTGCGSPYYLSLSAAARWQSSTHMRVRGVPASEIWLHPQSVLTAEKSLLIAVSRSGSTTETIKAISTYRQHFNLDPIVVSCYADNAMVSSTQYPFLTSGAEEKSVAQTKSFTSMLLMTQYLMLFASPEKDKLGKEMDRLPGCFSTLMKKHENDIKTIVKAGGFNHFVFLGSGIHYGLACEAMLKMKEMSLSISEAFHFLEFRHGPMSMVTNDTLVIGMINDATREEELKVLSDMRQIGAKTLVLAESAQNIVADYVFELDSGISPLLRGPLYMPLLQLFAYHQAMKKGLDADNPRNLSVYVELSD